MEEFVECRVRDIYKKLTDGKAPWLSCNCEACQTDAVAYVLNRVRPRYTTGTQIRPLDADRQLSADIDALAIDAVRVVSASKSRDPNHNKADSRPTDALREVMPSFNFPVITGVVLDGNTFSALSGAQVTLKDSNGNIVLGQDPSWVNPCITRLATGGVFNFWPKSVTAKKVGISQKFTFVAEASAKGYQSKIQPFDITLTSDERMRTFIDNSVKTKIADFVMFGEYD